MEPWFHFWYRGRVETLDAKYNLAYISIPLYVTTPTVQLNTDLSSRYVAIFLARIESSI